MRRQQGLMQSVDSFLRMQDEELQMLWWLIGSRSVDLDVPFEKLPPEAKPLFLAKELAEDTELLPGPPSIKGLLSRAGLPETAIDIARVINGADAVWLRGFLPEDEPSPVTTPIHYALKRQVETGAGQAWVAGWAAAVGAPTDLSVKSIQLAVLFYRERLLIDFADS